MSGRRISCLNRCDALSDRTAGSGFPLTILSNCRRQIKLRQIILLSARCSQPRVKIGLTRWSALTACAGRGSGPGGPGAGAEGVRRAMAAWVIEGGADSVAVIADLLREPRKSA